MFLALVEQIQAAKKYQKRRIEFFEIGICDDCDGDLDSLGRAQLCFLLNCGNNDDDDGVSLDDYGNIDEEEKEKGDNDDQDCDDDDVVVSRDNCGV